MSSVARGADRSAQLVTFVLWTTVVGGLIAIAWSLLCLYQTHAWIDVLPFMALAVLADILDVNMADSERERWSLSLGIAVMMAAVAVNPSVAPLVGVADGLFHVARFKITRPDKVLFNLTNISLSMFVASAAYLAVEPHLRSTGAAELVAGFCAAVSHYTVNTVGVSLMISLSARRPVTHILGESAWSLPINICLGLTGAFVGGAFLQLGLVGTSMFLVPLAVLLFTLRIFASKSRQTITTLESLNDQLSGEIVQRSVAEAALGESETHLRAVLDNVAEGILTVGDDGLIQTCNPAGERVFGFPAADIVGRHLGVLVPLVKGAPSTGFGQSLARARLGFEPHETTGRRRDESVFPIEVSIAEMRQDTLRFVVSVRDITERTQAQAALEHQTFYDTLTGLPNRQLLHDRLSQAILSARRDLSPMALLVMDLDRFKEVNDTLGHHYGDLLLREVGVRLRGTLREGDTAARLGGDEFAVLLPRANVNEAEIAARRLTDALDLPFMADGHPVEVAGSIGIAVFPEHGGDTGTLMRSADVAMYVAKGNQSEFSVYSPELDQHSPDRLSLAAELRTAIEQDQLELFYQPQADIATRRINSVEALVRWRHPQRGLVPPDEFIPLAEQTGLVRPLTRWVLQAALSQAQKWQRSGRALTIAVNLSVRDLQDPTLPEIVAGLLQTWDVSPSLLTLEITESTLMADPAQASEIVQRLSELGMHISIDDFGTGYSSLAYLKRLAVNELKVDQSFVRHLVTDAHDVAIVRSTINLAHELKLDVVAEGIEDQPTWDMLKELGCDTAQGYLISRPVPAADLERWLETSGWLLGTHVDAEQPIAA